MVAYSLISCSSDYFSMGIYTSLENLYVALRTDVYQNEYFAYDTIENLKDWYEIIQVNLDNEPLSCFEFSTHGIKIEIDWDKVLDKQ